SLDIGSFGGKELTNYLEYQIRVQSINGTWRSGYGEEVTAVPLPVGKPDKPDNVSAVGQYQRITVSWKQMKDTLSYNLYYKESGADQYQKIENIAENRYTIDGLKDLTEYTVYVTGVNEFGESGPSLSASAQTTDLNPPVITKYNLINIGQAGEAGAHIISASMSANMVDSPLDTQAGTAWGTVDHDPSSYYQMNSWDDGGYNPMSLRHGLTYEFDQAYKMDTIAFHDLTGQDTGYFYAKVRYWDESGKQTDVSGVSLIRKTDADGRNYYVLKLSQPINAKKLQFGLARYAASGTITISEVYFYYYDTLMDEIMALYEDDLHTVLRPEVTQADIDALRVKLNTIDEVSGEYHPDRALLELELQTAEAILNDKRLNDSVRLHSGITTNDVNHGFGGLNAWQPLGVVAAAQEEIMVYVGSADGKTGETTGLQLVATQYHAEAGSVAQVVASLKVGPNKVTVPKIWTTTGLESGGALYVQYTGNTETQYAVRVSGGVQVPRLDLYQVTDDAERLARTAAYVEQLQTYVSSMQELHGEYHAKSDNSQVAYAYEEQNCILGASDILLDTMLFSLPAQQILKGAGSGSVEEQARKILNSMDAMEDMMYLFYQHKGLNADAVDAADRIPKGHLNIRYQRMFSGAFMYASGNHIGIEWGSTAGMVTSVPVVSDSEGRYQSGSYFGWGIAHEIGHCINQGTYAIAEITNNYFAVLAQAKDSNDSVRFQYSNVYKKVTSGAKGMASNVFTQLGMYWQLHLAYDKGYNYKTYGDYNEQLNNLFFARVDTYARNAAKAPAPGGAALTLAGDRDQDLMRLACAAAEKNILEFFERWGMTPDDTTRRYAEQFARETRAIYYVSDDARVYSLQGSGSVLGTEGTVEAVGDVSIAVSPQRANQVDFTLSSTLPQADVLGYEIVRCMISGGETQKEAIGFATGNTFSDTVTVNNRMVWYEITVIDKYLNRSAVKTLEPIKIEHDGSLNKTFWTVDTQNLSTEDTTVGAGDENSPCAPEAENPAGRMIDDNPATVYTAVAADNAEITLNFNKTLTVTGFKYTGLEGAAGSGYELHVYTGNTWVKAAEGSFGQETSGTIFFANEDGKYISTYAAAAVKLILKAQSGCQISVQEMDVLGVTGDNVDFRRTDDNTVAIGKLSADYQYGTEAGDVIPAGSIVFTGAYKGNPAYNVVLLFDQNGNNVGGVNEAGELKAQQIILADVPAEGNIQNVSDGTWIYWIEPDQQADLTGITSVRAELYRVNNALTNEGQRLVSDSLFEVMPDTLPEIQIHIGTE
ncbi:MAG: M60 family metallopeptidase, partial [Acetatifactor sp.]|nr:M60 family metallopeptidase [Acetatifactor sp.]